MTDLPHKLGHELFIDRTSSKRLVEILRRVGFSLQSIYDVYPNGQDERVRDPDWIKQCGENNWVVITGDKRIETVPENRQAVIDARARVFLLNDSNTKPEVWAAAILLGQYKMQDILDATVGPFFVTIGKRCDSHVLRPRRPSGYEQQPEVSAVQAPVIKQEETETVHPKPSGDGKTTRQPGLPFQ